MASFKLYNSKLISEGPASLGHRLLHFLPFGSQVVLAIPLTAKMVVFSDNVLVLLNLLGDVLQVMLLLSLAEML